MLGFRRQIRVQRVWRLMDARMLLAFEVVAWLQLVTAPPLQQLDVQTVPVQEHPVVHC